MDIMDITVIQMIHGIIMIIIIIITEIMHIPEVEPAVEWVVRAITQEVVIAHQQQRRLTAEEFLLL